MAKFSVGQKVVVRSDLQDGLYYGLFFNREMKSYCGETLTIAGVIYDSYYGITEYTVGENGWNWTDEMLTEKVMERKVLNIECTAKMEIYVDRVIINDPATIMFYRVARYDDNNGRFLEWGDERKVIAKCNKEGGDKFDVGKGVEIATLKAYRKEIDKLLRKM